jgi:hypothetical protein
MSAERHATTDPDGRSVVLDERSIGHLRRRRPQMLAHIDAILGAIERPDHREDDVVAGRERFYRRDLTPRRWLRVVVDFNEVPGFVVTAFIQDTQPGTKP